VQTNETLAAAEPLVSAGLAVHWLAEMSKRPYHTDWTNRPVHTLETLRAEYRAENNLGVRCGAPSKTPSGYLHIIDLDIREPEFAAAAHAALDRLLPDWRTMPTAISGSGGASRHIYVFTAEPLRSRKLARSEGSAMVWSAEKRKEVQKRDWEIDLKGTGTQVVMPPSIHPETGQPYRWERELDATDLLLGLYDQVDPATLGAELVEAPTEEDDDDLLAAARTAPLGLDEAEIDRTLRDLPSDWVEDRDLWYQVGMALHHEYEGADVGREKWFEWSKQSAKFDPRDAARVWRSFKNRTGRPVRMATLIQAAGTARTAGAVASWMPDDDDDLIGDAPAPAKNAWSDLIGDDEDDILGPAPAPSRADPGANPRKDWTSLLAVSEDGTIKTCLHNVEVIVANDARLYGRLGVNLLLQSKVFIAEPAKLAKKSRDGKPIRQLDGPIWQLDEPGHAIDGKRWIDDHENALRSVIEAPSTQGGYALKVSDRDLRAAVNNVANQNTFHPIRDRLRSFVWDGVPRAEKLFIDYLGSPDDAYHREAAKLMLLGAVARVFCPGHKFDFVAILEGAQGAGKSTFIRILGLDWASELAVDFHDNNRVIEALQGGWIIEIPELQGFSKADTTVLKAVISRTHDKGRLAWERSVRAFPRQCIFIGSTNDEDYLRDTTGGRRFWPVRVTAPVIDTDKLRGEIEQIWAEVLSWYDAMRKARPRGDLPLYLRDPRSIDTAKQLQDSRRTETPEELLAAEIKMLLDAPVETTLEGHSRCREVTCIKEVWIDLLGNDPIDLQKNQILSRTVARAMRLAGWEQDGTMKHHKYGTPKAFKRKT
jgi:hypothetical protein